MENMYLDLVPLSGLDHILRSFALPIPKRNQRIRVIRHLPVTNRASSLPMLAPVSRESPNRYSVRLRPPLPKRINPRRASAHYLRDFVPMHVQIRLNEGVVVEVSHSCDDRFHGFILPLRRFVLCGIAQLPCE